MRRALTPTPLPSGRERGNALPGNDVDRAIALAESKLGARYVWATAGPDTFDCSGFTWWVASQVLGPLDYELRSSHHQFNVWGEALPNGAELLPGDLVFFDTMSVVVMGNRASHVGLHIAGGDFIHAASEDLGVRIDNVRGAWYWPKFIGARRIFAPEEPAAERPAAAGPRKMLPRLDRKPATPNQWNGGELGVAWNVVTDWEPELASAAAAENVDILALATVMMMETQGIHWRDGKLLQMWDDFPEDGPAVGIMQLKPRVWGWLAPELDAAVPAQNILLAAKIIRFHLNNTGGDLDAAMRRWFTARDPNGTTPESYMRTFWGLMGELGYGA